MKTALVLGAGGFIGSWMVKRLKIEGYYVRGVDLKYPEFSETECDEFLIWDLTNQYNFQILILPKSNHFDEIYQFAADMGGAGYVFTGEHDSDIMTNSALINLNVLRQLQRMNYKGKIFYSSSACIYPQELQNDMDAPYYIAGLKESDAYPAHPDSEYGWEKLFSERLYLSYSKNYGLDVRIGRFHNIYGPEGTYEGGREKAPAAICRKAIEANESIDIWGDGGQARSFLYIDDCIDTVRLLMKSDFKQPINIGSEEMISIEQLAKIAITFSGKKIDIKYVNGPQGVRGRNSDNTLIRSILKWEPKFALKDGLYSTFNWIKKQIDGRDK